MEHVRWLADIDEATLTNPVVVAAFTGWNDAGDAASIAVRTMIETSGASALAEIDPEPFTDFATVRPHVRLDAQRNRSIVWPTVGVWSASLPGTDVILVLGPEPALRWRLFCEQIGGIADHFAVNIIPHSWSHTHLPTRKVGDAVNVEVDMLARYVARQLAFRSQGHRAPSHGSKKSLGLVKNSNLLFQMGKALFSALRKIAPKKLPFFKVGKELKDRVDG